MAVLIPMNFAAVSRINVCSLIICWKGNYYAPSLMMFSYLLIVIILIIRVLQEWFFPEAAFKHLMEKEMNPQMQLQLQMSMRTEISVRFMDFLTGLAFFYDQVYLSESEEHPSVIEWSASGKFYLATFGLKSCHIFMTM
jgi:hypothetical protein